MKKEKKRFRKICEFTEQDQNSDEDSINSSHAHISQIKAGLAIKHL